MHHYAQIFNFSWQRYQPVNVENAKYIGLLILFSWINYAFGETIVTYPRPESTSDSRGSYPAALLALCATKIANGFTPKPSEFHTQQGRSIRLLARQEGIDVLWTVTNEERERLLLPVRIPIDRGLIGWRLLLINKHNTELFTAISKKETLAQMRAGQGHDWPDTAVLRANHFNVVTSTTYEGLFHMLARGHIHYFPRSLSEIWPESALRADRGISVQPTLIIHYPAALYYFVNRSNTKLANTLTSCLEIATEDGSLRNLFYDYYRESIDKSDLLNRTVIELTNPLFPKDTPSLPDNYWFDPQEIR